MSITFIQHPQRRLPLAMTGLSSGWHLRNRYGSRPLANIRMANALKFHNYDLHFSFGQGTHNSGHGAAEFAAEMLWFRHEYDPARTSQTYAISAEEKAKRSSV